MNAPIRKIIINLLALLAVSCKGSEESQSKADSANAGASQFVGYEKQPILASLEPELAGSISVEVAARLNKTGKLISADLLQFHKFDAGTSLTPVWTEPSYLEDNSRREELIGIIDSLIHEEGYRYGESQLHHEAAVYLGRLVADRDPLVEGLTLAKLQSLDAQQVASLFQHVVSHAGPFGNFSKRGVQGAIFRRDTFKAKIERYLSSQLTFEQVVASLSAELQMPYILSLGQSSQIPNRMIALTKLSQVVSGHDKFLRLQIFYQPRSADPTTILPINADHFDSLRGQWGKAVQEELVKCINIYRDFKGRTATAERCAAFLEIDVAQNIVSPKEAFAFEEEKIVSQLFNLPAPSIPAGTLILEPWLNGSESIGLSPDHRDIAGKGP